MKKPNGWLFVTILFLAPFICAIELLAAVPAKKIRLAYSAFAYANPPFWIAKDLRIFEKHGLDVELVYVGGARNIQALIGGSIDVSQVGSAPTVAAADRLKHYGLANLIGNPLETTIAQASLIFGGVLDRLPALKICCAHGGGYAPWIRGRWRHGHSSRREARDLITRPVYEYLGRMYFDTCVFDPDSLEFLIKTMGSDHVLLGTDYPTPMIDAGQVPVINGIKGLTDQDKEKVLGGNAARLLGLTKSA